MASLACTYIAAVASSAMAVSLVSVSGGLAASSRSVAFGRGSVSRVPLRVYMRRDEGVKLL